MGPLNPELAGEKVTLAGCMPGMGVGPHLLRLPSWEPRVALPHETIPRTKTWADRWECGPTPRCPRSPPAKGDPCFHCRLPMPAPGTHTSPPLLSLSNWTCSDHLLGLPFRSRPKVFLLYNFTPMPPCPYSSMALHSPQDKDRAPYPGIQGLSSCPMATVIVNAMCVLA